MKKLLSFATLALLSISVNAQSLIKLKMDPTVKVGKLANGLTYYIKKNTEPKNRAQLRMVVKAGSILENDDQRGLAHLMEHMNFNGTKNFKKNELVDFLEKSGIKFGADLNAYTSFDETVYMLPVPTDTLTKLEKYITVLADWASRATLDHSEIDKERGVVLEESRLGKGAQERIKEKLLPVIFRGSKYASRLPIGLDSIIQNSPYKSLESFYKDWYRPDLQAVIAVGDFDVAKMEAMIIKHFSAAKNSVKPPKRTQYSVPLKGGTDAVIITDKEQPYNLVQLFYMQPEKNQRFESDRIENIEFALFNNMISNRLSELMQSANPPYQFGMSNYSSFLGNLDALAVIAVAKGADIETALKAVLEENERAKKFGFTEAEFKRAKDDYFSQVEKQFNEKNKTESESYVSELVSCFLNDVPMTSIDFDYDFLRKHSKDIKLANVNALVKKIITKENRVLAVLGSENDKEKLPTVEKLKALLDNTSSNIEAYKEEKVASSLLNNIPKDGKIATEDKNGDVNVTTLIFENGARVFLKPTDFKNDEIKIKATSWGGQSLYENPDFINAKFASAVAGRSGMGKLSTTQLDKFMSGKIANIAAIVAGNSEGLSGSSNQKDFETALQMIYSRFTENQLDVKAVQGFISNQEDFLLNQEKTPTPEKVYQDTVAAVLANYNERAMPMTAAKINTIDPVKAMEIFNSRFADASDFDFFMVGNFDIEKIKPLLSKYIGGLPSRNNREKFIDRKIIPPSGQITKIVKKGTADKATVQLFLSGEFDGSNTESQLIDALGEILSIKLTEKLREEESGVYSPHVSGSSNVFPSPRYIFRINFGCSPANVDKLINLTLAEIEKIKMNGADVKDIEKYVSNQKLNFQTDLKSNDFWINEMSGKIQKGENLNSILTEDKDLEILNIQSTKAAALKYISGKDLIKIILLPETK